MLRCGGFPHCAEMLPRLRAEWTQRDLCLFCSGIFPPCLEVCWARHRCTYDWTDGMGLWEGARRHSDVLVVG